MEQVNFNNTAKYKHVGEIVKDYRISKKISQKELSEKSGVSRGYICDLETERKKSAFPSVETLISLAQVLTDTEEEKENFILKMLSLKLPETILKKIDKVTMFENAREIKITGSISSENKMIDLLKTTDTTIVKNINLGENVFGIRVSDNSLEPVIDENSIVIIDKDIKDWDRIKEKIVLVSYKDKMYIRRVFLYNNGTIILLKSLNPNMEEIIIPSEDIENFKIYGKVIKAITEKIF